MMSDEQAFEQRLQVIVADDFKASSRPELDPLVLAMGTYIASVDAGLRDEPIRTAVRSTLARYSQFDNG